MSPERTLLINASVVAIAGRALAIEGAPGSDKSSLALALIDRGAVLVGDDGVLIERAGDRVIAHPPPRIAGLLEVHGVGLVKLPTSPPTPLALILTLGMDVPRLPEALEIRQLLGCAIPVLPFAPGTIAPAARAEWALREHGLA
jgi:serine kinase of HPr protein (carbohydrate metabolism regulator)